MDITLALGALQDLLHLFAGDVFGVLAGSDEKLRYIAYADAHVALDIAYAFAADALSFAASAYHCTERVIFVEPVGEVLHADGGGRSVDGLFHRNDVHADPRASGRHELSSQFQRLLGSEVEHGRHFRMQVRERLVLDHIFAGTNDPFGHTVLDVMIFVVPVLLQNTDPQQVVDDLLRFLLADVIAFCKLSCSKTYILVHGAGKLTRNVVGDHPGELHHHLFLDGIVAVMVLYGIVSFIDMYSRVYLFGHRKPPYAD